MNLTDLLQTGKGFRTYLAAAGLAVTAVIQFRAGDLLGATQSASAALAAFGLRSVLADLLTKLAVDVAAKLPSVPPAVPVQQTYTQTLPPG